MMLLLCRWFYRKFRSRLCLSLLCLSNWTFGQSATDTAAIKGNAATDKIYYSLQGSFSGSYISFMNWQQEDNKYLSFLSNVDYRHRKIKDNGWIHDHSIKAELGYFKYSDSLWLKSADQFKVGLHWTERSSRKIIHSYSLLMQSQFLKSYRFERDEEGVAVARLKGFFMAPGLIELAYGLTWNFYDLCRLNIAFATCRLRIYPRKGEEQNTDESLFFTADRIVKSEYGFSSQLFITRDFYGKHLIWENQSRLFFNAMSRNGVHFDSNNRFAVRFLKFLQFRIDTHFIYDPDFSKKASYRQELLLGIFYELKK